MIPADGNGARVPARLRDGRNLATAAHDARPFKRSFKIAGHATSISLEAAFWDALQAAAQRRNRSVAGLVAEIDATRGQTNLSSAVRVWLLADALARAAPSDPAVPRQA